MKRLREACELAWHQSAVEAAETYVPTPAACERAEAFLRSVRERIAEERRAWVRARGAPSPKLSVPPSILALARDALVSRLRELVVREPSLQLAFRDLSHQSDHDLRLLLTALEAAANEGA